MKKSSSLRLVLFALALLLLVLTGFQASASELTVELPAVIEARGGGFYLGEYAVFTGDQELSDRASMAFITPSGNTLERKDIIYALGASGLGGRLISLRMQDKITVTPESRIINELRAMTGWQWRIEAESPPDEFIGSFSLSKGVRPGAGSISILFDDAGGKNLRRQIKLKWYQPVLYSRVNIMRGAPLDSADLGSRIETIRLHKSSVWDRTQLKGAMSKQSILAGRAITLSDLERAQVIKSGTIITLVATINGLGVEARGMALQHGGIGDIIRVRNLASKKVLTGRVIDMGRVEIN